MANRATSALQAFIWWDLVNLPALRSIFIEVIYLIFIEFQLKIRGKITYLHQLD